MEKGSCLMCLKSGLDFKQTCLPKYKNGKLYLCSYFSLYLYLPLKTFIKLSQTVLAQLYPISLNLFIYFLTSYLSFT